MVLFLPAALLCADAEERAKTRKTRRDHAAAYNEAGLEAGAFALFAGGRGIGRGFAGLRACFRAGFAGLGAAVRIRCGVGVCGVEPGTGVFSSGAASSVGLVPTPVPGFSVSRLVGLPELADLGLPAGLGVPMGACDLGVAVGVCGAAV